MPPNILAHIWIPLRSCALCLNDDCETLYPLAYPACPRCAGTARAAVATWLGERGTK